jgi:probable F420-dependent oxidoreductase
VGLGTSVLVAPYRHPVVMAKALASLDALSGGRVICGVASGWHEGEFAALGVPFAERGARTDEAIRLCQALWAGEGDFAGRFTRLRAMRLAPPPSRPGGPPVWIGGNSDAGLRRAVRLGQGWHTTISDPAPLAERLGALDAVLAAAGRGRDGLTISSRVRADPDRVAALAPRLAALGVDHLLVDLPRFNRATFAGEVAALREVV